MSHEESFFFVGLLLLIVLLSLHSRYRPQFYAALSVLPCVVISLVLNNRRADYLAFMAGCGVVWVLMFVIEPRRRKALVIILLLSSTLLSGYILLFGPSTASYAAPAHAIVAVFSPSQNDARDADSNLYRTVEIGDLRYTINRSNLWLGLGFGKPYSQPVPLVDVFPYIDLADVYYNYVPHNNIYWVWMRLGAIGFLTFWYLIGSIVVHGSLIARQLRDHYLQVVAIYAVAMTFMEVIVAYADYQLFTYRNVIYIGLLAGMLMKLPELDKDETA